MTAHDVDLQHAHVRIAELERFLAGGPEPRRAQWPGVLLGCALAAAILLIGGAIPIGIFRQPEVVIHVAPAAPPPTLPPGELEVFSPRFLWDADGPSLVDVEGKGSAHDLVMVGWRHGHADRPLHVVALRRATYEVLWRSEAFSAKRSNGNTALVAMGDKVAVSDARGDVHVLDARSGKELHSTHAPPFEGLATLASDPGAVFSVRARGYPSGHDETTYRIDLGTGDISASPIPAGRFQYECRVDRARPCRSEPRPDAKAKLRTLVSDRAADFAVDLVDDEERITVFDTAERPQLVDHQLFAWGADGKTLKWRASAVPRPRRAIQGAGSASEQWLALGNHRVVAVYLVGPEGHRVSAHDAATGKLAYDAALPDLPYGIEVERLTLDGDVGFIQTTGALFVLDATTGKVTKTLRRF